ncbi:hypothetical protein [Methyloglobulus sp.]|uniref:hypothetical protein n=1 Tax=Methyloglobulus sp. TaxID=2518622 RepID=UPI003989D570
MSYRFVDAKTVTVEQPAGDFSKTAGVEEKPEVQNSAQSTDTIILAPMTVVGETESPNLTTPSIAESRQRLIRVPGATTVIDGERIKEGAPLTVSDALANTAGVWGIAVPGPPAARAFPSGAPTSIRSFRRCGV